MKIKKLLSLILAVLLLCTSVPVAFAETTIPASSLSCGDTFTLGRWPQMLVEDEQLIEELNKISVNLQSFGYTYGNKSMVHHLAKQYKGILDVRYADLHFRGEKYRKVVFTDLRKTDTAAKKQVIETNGCYYFKWEPIEWLAMPGNDGEVYAITRNIVDSQPFTYAFEDVDWSASFLRAWLQDIFFAEAFTNAEQQKLQGIERYGSFDKITVPALSDFAVGGIMEQLADTAGTAQGYALFEFGASEKAPFGEHIAEWHIMAPDADIINQKTETPRATILHDRYYLRGQLRNAFYGIRALVRFNESEEISGSETAANYTTSTHTHRFEREICSEQARAGQADRYYLTCMYCDKVERGDVFICAEDAPSCADNEHSWNYRVEYGESETVHFTCEKCGLSYSVDLGDETLPDCPNGSHRWESYIFERDCENREISFDCIYENCRESMVFRLPESEQKHHNYAKEEKAPTCTREGYVRYKCQNPGCLQSNYTEWLNPLGHDYAKPDYTVLRKAATCTDNAVYVRCCARCHAAILADGKNILDEKPNTALGHCNFLRRTTQYALRTPATNAMPATYYYTCGRCGKPAPEEGFFYGSNASTALHDFYAGDIIQMGSYPQSLVTDESLLETLDKQSVQMQSFGYSRFNTKDEPVNMTYGDFEYCNERYRKVVIDEDRPLNLLNDTAPANSKAGTYYFLWEPLNWVIARTYSGTSKLVCLNIIDFQSYFTAADFEKFFENNTSLAERFGEYYQDGVYSGDIGEFLETISLNYDKSHLRNWLNNEFVNSAFDETVSDNLSNISDILTRNYYDNFNDKVCVLDKATLTDKAVEKVLTQNNCLRAAVSEYALITRPDFSENTVNGDNGIYYYGKKPYAESAFNLGSNLGTTCLPKVVQTGLPNNIKEKTVCYEKINKELIFAPYYGVRPVIQLSSDYIPDCYVSLQSATIDGAKSSAVKVFDVNGDNVIDLSDISIVLANIGNEVEKDKNEECDVNLDEQINVVDISSMLLSDVYGANAE